LRQPFGELSPEGLFVLVRDAGRKSLAMRSGKSLPTWTEIRKSLAPALSAELFAKIALGGVAVFVVANNVRRQA
jgi:hypothetical protein